MMVELSKLMDGDILLKTYQRIENIACSGTHLRGRDYTQEDKAVSQLSKELNINIEDVVKKNRLDTSKKWHLVPPTMGYDWALRDW